MGYYNFKRDLKLAKKTEKEIVSILSKKYSTFEFIKFNNTSDYDLKCKINNRIQYVEIKEDFYCKKSGNVAVEYESRNKKSGILNTKAHLQIYKVHDVDKLAYVFYCTSRMRWIINKKLYFKKVVGGDKGSNTRMFLFKKDIFYKYANDVLYEYGEK